jgi:hypothetical protein
LALLQAFVDSETRARKGITLDEIRPVASQAFSAGIRAYSAVVGSTKLPRQAIQYHRRRPSGYAGGPFSAWRRTVLAILQRATKYSGATVPCLPQCEMTTVA